ncbi:MAG: hypothetical protein IT173_12185 [Acidobacteria bacterium]|nr:hypothetical protein [Acidobacteriota bacterium]
MVELSDKPDRHPIGTAKFDADRIGVAKDGRVSQPVKLIGRSDGRVDRLSCPNAAPAGCVRPLNVVKRTVREIVCVFEIGILVLAKERSQPVNSKAKAIAKITADLCRIVLNEPLKNFIYLFLR